MEYMYLKRDTEMHESLFSPYSKMAKGIFLIYNEGVSSGIKDSLFLQK